MAFGRAMFVPFAIALAFSLVACGTTSKTTRPAAASKPAAEDAPAAGGQVELPVVRLGQEVELKGFTGVVVADTGLAVFLKKVRWSEVEIDGKKFREGYADLGVRSSGAEESIRIDVNDKGMSRGYEIELRYIGDAYDDQTGRKIPHAKLVVRRP